MSDIVIIGGGVIGSAIAAFTLANPAYRGTVTVIERDPSYARASSALSASSIRQQFSTPVNIQIGLAGIEFMRAIGVNLALDNEQPDIGLTEPGYLFLATDAGVATLEENHRVQRDHGADVTLLSPAALRARFPWLCTDGIAAGSLGLSGEGWFDGYALLHAFRRKARSLGAIYRTADASGFDLTTSAEGTRINALRLADGARVAGDQFVNAAGPWARAVASWAGIDLPVFARRRSVYVFDSPERALGCPLVIDPAGVYFRPDGNGFICGTSPQASNDPDEPPLDPEPDVFQDIIWPVLAARVPGFESLRQQRAWAGYYEFNTVDANGLVGRYPGLENLIFANGFSGHGLQQSPAVGRGVSELLVHGGYQSLDLSALSPVRLIANQPLIEKNVV